MRVIIPAIAVCTALLAGLASQPATAAGVKITPLGLIDGEFCPFDRAPVFEDPVGTRILYDPGRTVAGPNDPRLAKIDFILLSHMHRDHVGDKHQPTPNAGSCGKPTLTELALPNTNLVNIALAKGATIVSGSEMQGFLGNKLKSLGGNAKKSQLACFGSSRSFGGVKITTVPAVHSNGVHPAMIGGDLGKMMAAAGLAGYVGPPTGFVLTFSNGLVAYLSGDTGVTAEQETVVRRHYQAKLVVMNIGDVYTTGPTEAAYVINQLVKPNAVIASHANELATEGGKVRAGSKTEAFIKATKVPVHVPLSGRTMEFDAAGRCVSGCG